MNAKKQILKMLVVAMGIVLLAQAVPAGADEVTLGYDRDLNVRYTITNGGTRTYTNILRVGTFFSNYYYRGWIAFDLSTLPAYDEITSLTLRINGTEKDTVTAYAISQADGDWTSSTPSADLWNGSYGAPVGTYDADAGGWVFTGDLTALIGSWVSGENAGFLLIGEEVPGLVDSAIFTSGSEVLDVGYTTIPEPATMAMLGLGGVMMLIRRRRKVA